MIRRSILILALALAALVGGACTQPDGGAGAPAAPTPASSGRSDYSY